MRKAIKTLSVRLIPMRLHLSLSYCLIIKLQTEPDGDTARKVLILPLFADFLVFFVVCCLWFVVCLLFVAVCCFFLLMLLFLFLVYFVLFFWLFFFWLANFDVVAVFVVLS